MKPLFQRVAKEEAGGAGIGYALIAFAVAIIVGATELGTALNTMFNNIESRL